MPRTKVTIPNVAEAAPGLWSNCISAGDLLFIAGQVARPLEGGSTLVGSNEYEQTRQIFSRIKCICEGAGGSLDDIVKMTIYMVNIKNNTEVWRARREFFTGDFPPCVVLGGVAFTAPDMLIEVDAWAILGCGE